MVKCYMFVLGKTEFVGPLLLPICYTHRLFPPLTDFKFKFVLSTPIATLIAPKPAAGASLEDYRIKLHALDLFIQRFRLFPKVEETVWRSLGPGKNCLYPLIVPRVTTMTIDRGNYGAEKVMSYGGLARLPTTLLVAMVDRDWAFSMTTGDKYNFQVSPLNF